MARWLVVVAVVAAAAFYAGTTTRNRAFELPTPPPSPSSRSAASPSSDLYTGVVETLFPFTASGTRLSLIVKEQDNDDGYGCSVLKAPSGAVFAVYDCRNVAGNELEPIFVYVEVRNDSASAVTIYLNRFVLDVFGAQSPVDVRRTADTPESFVQPRTLVPPGGYLRGLLAFDGQSIRDVEQDALEQYGVKSLSYVDDNQTLTVTFHL